MSGRRLRSLFVVALLVGLATYLLRRQDVGGLPDSSRHPSVDGGDRSVPAPSAAVEARVVAPTSAPAPASEPLVLDLRTPDPQATAASTPDLPAEAVPADGDRRWLPPVDGSCPDGYPVKAKLRSGIFHLPGMQAYGRTNPDRCYPSAAAAEADGLRAAKR